MTICIATSNYLPDECGITTFNLHLSDLLAQAGHKVIILTVWDKSTEAENDEVVPENNGVVIVRLKKAYHHFLRMYTPYFRSGGLNAPSWIAMGYAMRMWLSANKKDYAIDIIEASDYGGMGVFLCTNDFPPVVITAHGSLSQLLRYNYAKQDDHVQVIKQLETISFHKADAIITHSPLHQQELEKITTIPVLLATVPFQMKIAALSDNTTPPYVVTIGGLQTIKGAFVIAAALKKILVSRTIRIKWIGGDTYTANSQMSVAQKISLEYPELWGKSFEWLNSKTNKETLSFMAAASFVIIPSLWEAFNYVALEAASMGKAIIITDKTGAAHLFTHNVNALIIPADNDQALADAIHQLDTDKKLCEYLGANARRLIEEKISSTKIVEERIAIYKNAIEKPAIKEPIENSLQFISKYFTPARKFYFGARNILKRIFHPS